MERLTWTELQAQGYEPWVITPELRALAGDILGGRRVGWVAQVGAGLYARREFVGFTIWHRAEVHCG